MHADPFTDRTQAGRALARLLEGFAGRRDLVVLALPRGGVPVGFEVAAALRAPLDVLVVRKLGVPDHPEYAMGAIGPGGARVLNDDVVRTLAITDDEIARVTRDESHELARREALYREGRAAPDVAGRTVLLVDDGLATGATMGVAVKALRALRPARIVVAVPVGAGESCDALRALADQVVCALAPEPFFAVGDWYLDFEQTSDDEVRALLARAEAARRGQ